MALTPKAQAAIDKIARQAERKQIVAKLRRSYQLAGCSKKKAKALARTKCDQLVAEARHNGFPLMVKTEDSGGAE